MIRHVFARAALAAGLALASGSVVAQEPPAEGTGSSRPGAAPAQPPAPAPPAAGAAKGSDGPKGAATARPGPAAEELARTMVSERSWSAMIDGYAEALSTQISRALQARGEKPPDDVQQRVRSRLEGALDHQEGLQLEATELAARFSEAELRSIQTFYRSPAGQKLMKELPEMSASVDARIRERLTAAVPKIVQEVAPSLAEAQQPGASGAAPGGASTPGAAKPQPPAAQGRTPPPKK